jgi:hypothetical protein
MPGYCCAAGKCAPASSNACAPTGAAGELGPTGLAGSSGGGGGAAGAASAQADGATDAGPAFDAPPPPPLCLYAPYAGEVCNPVCQTGCAGGHCVLSDGHARCDDSPASLKVGELCPLLASGDRCAPGLVCLAESCLGGHSGRCYRLCASNDQCGGTACTIPIEDSRGEPSAYTACDVGPTRCDPVANTGCPSPELACYVVSSGDTICDCQTGAAPVHAACQVYTDCLPGLICAAGLVGETTPTCNGVCSRANPACPQGQSCIPASTGGDYGLCAGP